MSERLIDEQESEAGQRCLDPIEPPDGRVREQHGPTVADRADGAYPDQPRLGV
jgi:hypothetical protein